MEDKTAQHSKDVVHYRDLQVGQYTLGMDLDIPARVVGYHFTFFDFGSVPEPVHTRIHNVNTLISIFSSW